MRRAAVFWTGGKDSCLALFEAQSSGYEIVNLATFVPSKPRFFAHPLHFMKHQANALGHPHCTLTVRHPFNESYEARIRSLKRRWGINALVTGDIAEVDGQRNWIRECSKSSRIEVLTPLWGHDSRQLLNRLVARRFKAIFSCVKKPWFTSDWLGMELNEESVEHLFTLSAMMGFDACGEQGEYHTLVLDGPLFKKRICIEQSSKRVEDSLMHLDIERVTLRDK